MSKGTTVQVWFYLSEPNHEKAVRIVEEAIENGLLDVDKKEVKYVAEALK